jgi:serine/threonine protein kinase/Tfp pilus assembly protein PilF
MSTNPDLLLLARAYVQDLVTVDQISELLRELDRDESASISGLLKSRGLLSDDQVDVLLSSHAVAGAPSGWLDQGLPPVSGLVASSGGPLGRGSTVKSEDANVTQEFTPLGGVDGGHQQSLSVQPMLARGDRGLEVESRQQYVLMLEIGRGGLGRVRLAYDRQICREVAIKELLPHSLRSADKVNRFLREARVTGQLEHPGVVPIYATGLDRDGNPFYAMKRIGGRPLVQAIREYHALRPGDELRAQRLNELLSVFRSICQTMAFAHRRGVLHRDLKPQNVIVGDFGEAIVVDWGLAKILRRDQRAGVEESTATGEAVLGDSGGPIPLVDPDVNLETQMGTVVGTIAYMSPEQARGDATDHRSDIYSLGAILFELVTGEPPFRGKGQTILEQVKQGRIRQPRAVNPHVPRPLAAVCLKAMAKDPRDRYGSAKELAEEIVRWQSGEPPLAYRESLSERAVRWVKRHKGACQVAAASIAVFAIVVGAWSWQERNRVARIRQTADGHLQTAHRFFYRGDLEPASREIAQARAVAAGERRLQPMLGTIDDLRLRIEQRLRQDVEEQSLRRKLIEFEHAYNEALFHGLLAMAPDKGNDYHLARQAASRALGLFPVGSEPRWAALGGSRILGKDTRRDLESKQRELLLVEADLIAQGDPDRDPRSRAEEALRLLERATSGEPLRSLHQRRARYLSMAGRAREARQEEQLASQIEPQSSLDLFVLGDEQFKAGNFTAASQHFQHALQRDPNRFWAQCFLAASQLQSLQYGEAVANLTACATRQPDYPWIYLLRGLAYGLLRDQKSAEADFESALALTRDDQQSYRYAIYLNRGIARLRAGGLPGAIEDFEQAIQVDPMRWEALVNLAEAFRVKEEREHLLATMGLRQIGPILPVRFAPGYRAALAQLGRAIELDRNQPRAYLNRGRLQRQLGKTTSALADFRNAISLAQPHSLLKAQALCDYGRVVHEEGNYAEALRRYNAALSESPDYVDALYLRGLVLMDLNNAADAILSLDRFLTQSRILGEAYRHEPGDRRAQAGAASWLAGREEAERGDVAADLKLATLYRERALARMKMRDTFGGFHDSMLALDLVQHKADRLSLGDRERFAGVAARRGWALLTRNAELARESFDEAIRLNNSSSDHYAGRAAAWCQLASYDEAIADAQAALARQPVPEGIYNIASVYAGLAGRLGRERGRDKVDARVAAWSDEAIRLLRESFERMPREKRAYYLKEFAADPEFDSIRDRAEVKELVLRHSMIFGFESSSEH